MPEDVHEMVESIRDEHPEMDESEAWAIAYEQSGDDTEKRADLAKSAPNASISKMAFEISTEGSVGAVCKADDDFVIWGPASVEVVDKEKDRITAKALEDALPQLLKRKRLSYEHSDQIVGDILESFKTEEPVTVEVAGQTYERSEFPTDVLELEGLEKGLYVAGNIYNDTQKAREVRKDIDEGEVDSYSISGEAIVTEMAVKNGQTFTDILKLDLSAVTLCREGMNQKAKFDVVSKTEQSSLTPQRAAAIAKSRINHTMSDPENDEDIEKFVDALDDTLDDRLPDGELATKSDVEEMVEEKIDEKAQEDSPKEGTPERPSGDGEGGTQTDPEYEGDNPDNTSSDSDKVEEKGADNHPTRRPENFDEVEGDGEDEEKAYSMDELKSVLPDDQYKAIAPLLERDADNPEEYLDDGPDVDPRDDTPPEEVDADPMPDREPELDDEEGEPDPVLAAEKSLGVEWDRLTETQKAALMKSGALEKATSNVRTNPGVGTPTDPAHAGSAEGSEEVAKADSDSVSRDPAMRNVYDDEGKPQI